MYRHLLSILKQREHQYAFSVTIRVALMVATYALGFLAVYLLTLHFLPKLPLSLGLIMGIGIGAVVAAGIWSVYRWRQVSGPRRMARQLEMAFPSVYLSIRTALDLMEGKTDVGPVGCGDEYVSKTVRQLESLPRIAVPRRNWMLAALSVSAVVMLMWSAWSDSFTNRMTDPTLVFGDTLLQLKDGSITIYEPEYTNIPGRTLELKAGTYQAFPGSRVRIAINAQDGLQQLYLKEESAEKPMTIEVNDNGRFDHEFVLLNPVQFRFYMSKSTHSGQTQPYIFQTKTDKAPQVQIRSHTPEGPVNSFDPLFLDAVVKDDFSIAKLEAVITWADEERRLNVPIPNNQRTHFLSRNRWSISELVPEDTQSFSIYLEARDNNPIDGPGIGQSEVITYELESPERRHDELMELARQLLDRMTHVLGDNLDTTFASSRNRGLIEKGHTLSTEIQEGLHYSQNITTAILGLMRKDPYITTLDREFLRKFRERVIRSYRDRMEIGQLYTSINQSYQVEPAFRSLKRLHLREEVKIEELVYDLLMQLKMWALLELERSQTEIEDMMQALNELLENADQLSQSELEQELDRLMEQLMKEFQEMMQKTANEMDASMEEFMNMDGMQDQKDAMDELREKIKEAMKSGDMEKVKKLMEQFQAMMQNAMSQMQQAMGEMSPEMKKMMQDLKEMMGLLKELKEREESLEAETQALKSELDQEMGGNQPEFNEQEREEQAKIMDNIRRLLNELHQKLVGFQQEGIREELMNEITELKKEMDNGDLSDSEKIELQVRLTNVERTLEFVINNSLDRLQDATIQGLEQAEQMQEMLDQGELIQSLETGYALEGTLLNGERQSDRGLAPQIRDEAQPKETFLEARHELYQILEALQTLREGTESRRSEFMKQSGKKAQTSLAKKQADINQMIKEFKEKTEESLEGSQLLDKLEDIAMSMRNAERKLGSSKLDGGIRYEQEALQKIGEMMEQMQQALQSQSGSGSMGMGLRRESMDGDPTGEVYIPDSQKTLKDDQLRDAIRKQMQRNMPDSFGKEIRKYYENLMDQ